MNSSQFNLIQKLTFSVMLLILAGVLGACGSVPGAALGGAGGLADEDVTATEVTAAPVEIEDAPPTSTPLPGPVGHIIFVSNRDGQTSLYKTTPDGSEQIRLTNTGSEDVNPHISPDGTRVAFESTVNSNMDIYVLDLNTLSITQITDSPGKDSSPSWSPDGTQLAFESFRDDNFEIYIANADGSNQVRLTNDPAGDNSPVWSPVANEIAFVSNRFGNADILLVNPNGIISPLTTNSAPDSTPAWSPNGSMIAYKTYSGDLTNLCLIGRDGLNQRCVTPFASEYSTPAWSPDGSKLAASAKQTNGYGVNIFNVVDNTVTEFASAGIEPSGTPVWSPEGIFLTFQAQVEGGMELYMISIPNSQFSRITSIPSYNGEPAWSQK